LDAARRCAGKAYLRLAIGKVVTRAEGLDAGDGTNYAHA
jgi:hypothetical protein